MSIRPSFIACGSQLLLSVSMYTASVSFVVGGTSTVNVTGTGLPLSASLPGASSGFTTGFDAITAYCATFSYDACAGTGAGESARLTTVPVAGSNDATAYSPVSGSRVVG